MSHATGPWTSVHTPCRSVKILDWLTNSLSVCKNIWLVHTLLDWLSKPCPAERNSCMAFETLDWLIRSLLICPNTGPGWHTLCFVINILDWLTHSLPGDQNTGLVETLLAWYSKNTVSAGTLFSRSKKLCRVCQNTGLVSALQYLSVCRNIGRVYTLFAWW